MREFCYAIIRCYHFLEKLLLQDILMYLLLQTQKVNKAIIVMAGMKP
jgi:hypothetical protein